jgi:hypothetical protein
LGWLLQKMPAASFGFKKLGLAIKIAKAITAGSAA